ncbi:MAG: class I SAM-dependent methyltransferase [Anaerolineae bacterium]|nr:class I SAM-dependent methyltransferase [Anaerolineae bacterium]
MCSLLASGVQFRGRRVLDIGTHDGILLSLAESELCVGVDLSPQHSRGPAVIVQADGNHLPFCSGCFDQVIATDVIEHMPHAQKLVNEMLRVVHPGGKIFLSTPSVDIRLFPPFLTGWISNLWGHYWRRGFTKEELLKIMSEGRAKNTILLEWNAPAYRFCYLILRLLWVFAPSLVQPIVKIVARWDALHVKGCHGFYWIWAEKGEN